MKPPHFFSRLLDDMMLLFPVSHLTISLPVPSPYATVFYSRIEMEVIRPLCHFPFFFPNVRLSFG